MAPGRRHGAGRPRPTAPAVADDGFSLLEMVVALAVIGIVMGALSTFFIATMSTVSQQSGLQIAAQLASDRMEQVRAADQATELVGGTDTEQRNGIGYARSWEVRRCWQPTSPRSGTCTYSSTRPAGGGWADFVEVTVQVRWPDRRCAPDPCSYRTATLISRAELEPLFHVRTTA